MIFKQEESCNQRYIVYLEIFPWYRVSIGGAYKITDSQDWKGPLKITQVDAESLLLSLLISCPACLNSSNDGVLVTSQDCLAHLWISLKYSPYAKLECATLSFPTIGSRSNLCSQIEQADSLFPSYIFCTLCQKLVWHTHGFMSGLSVLFQWSMYLFLC